MAHCAELVELVKTAYRTDADEVEWLGALCQRAHPLLDGGQGVFAYVWELREGHPVMRSFTRTGSDPSCELYPDHLLRMLGSWRIRRLLLGRSATASALGWLRGGGEGSSALELLPAGAADVAMVLGRAQASGLVVAVPLAARARWTPTQRRAWSIVAAHWGFALELRAILCQSTAGFSLPAALGPLRRAPQEEAQQVLKGLTDGDWLATQVISCNEGQLLLAVRRDGEASACRLSGAERAVAAAAARGHGHQRMATDLGMSTSRVAYHLRAAMLKLAVSNRAELQQLWRLTAAEPATHEPRELASQLGCEGTG